MKAPGSGNPGLNVWIERRDYSAYRVAPLVAAGCAVSSSEPLLQRDFYFRGDDLEQLDMGWELY